MGVLNEISRYEAACPIKRWDFSGLVEELRVSPESLCYMLFLKPLPPPPPAKHTASVLQKLAVS